MKSYCVSTSQKTTREYGIRQGNLDGRPLKRQRYRDFVARMLPGAACAIGPHFEGELLLLDNAKAKPHEEQRLAREAEHFRETHRAGIHEQRLDQRLAHTAALLIFTNGQCRNLGSRSEEHTSELQSR